MPNYLRRKFAEIIDEVQPNFADVADVTASMTLGLFLKASDFAPGENRLSTFDLYVIALRGDLIEAIENGEAVD